jgi:hypothetical protein
MKAAMGGRVSTEGLAMAGAKGSPSRLEAVSPAVAAAAAEAVAAGAEAASAAAGARRCCDGGSGAAGLGATAGGAAG